MCYTSDIWLLGGRKMEEILIAVYYLSALILASFVVKTYRKDTVISRKLAIAMLMNFLMILAYTLNISAEREIVKTIGCLASFVLMDFMLYCYYDYNCCGYNGYGDDAREGLSKEKYLIMYI